MTAADIHGPWVDPGWESDLIERARRWWSVPITDLPDAGLALFLRQRIAVGPALDEARRRLAEGVPDDSELYDGELEAAVAAPRQVTPNQIASCEVASRMGGATIPP